MKIKKDTFSAIGGNEDWKRENLKITNEEELILYVLIELSNSTLSRFVGKVTSSGQLCTTAKTASGGERRVTS